MTKRSPRYWFSSAFSLCLKFSKATSNEKKDYSCKVNLSCWVPASRERISYLKPPPHSLEEQCCYFPAPRCLNTSCLGAHLHTQPRAMLREQGHRFSSLILWLMCGNLGICPSTLCWQSMKASSKSCWMVLCKACLSPSCLQSRSLPKKAEILSEGPCFLPRMNLSCWAAVILRSPRWLPGALCWRYRLLLHASLGLLCFFMQLHLKCSNWTVLLLVPSRPF